MGAARLLPPCSLRVVRGYQKGRKRGVWEAPPLYSLLQKNKAQREGESKVSPNLNHIILATFGYLPLREIQTRYINRYIIIITIISFATYTAGNFLHVWDCTGDKTMQEPNAKGMRCLSYVLPIQF